MLNGFRGSTGRSWAYAGKQSAVALLSLALQFAAASSSAWGAEIAAQPPPYTQHTPDQLQQLVAPIALYPDSLVAQIVAASTFPEQVVEADRLLQAHPELKGDALGKAADQETWDPSVKALVAFPTVLGNMDKNLTWTSSLGDAYYNQPGDVMDAVQTMRRRAKQAGTLKTTPQQTVTNQDDAVIVVEPVTPAEVYVPAYDPWTMYGAPISAWPGWYEYPGIWYGGPYLAWGGGFDVGYYGGYGWGWPSWGFDWRNRAVMHDHNRYYSRSGTFFHRGNYYAATAAHGASGGHASAGNRAAGASTGEHRAAATHLSAAPRPFNGSSSAVRGYADPRGQSGVRSSAFSGYEQGGQVRRYSSRGGASAGRAGGGGARAAGGGGGGGHGGNGGHH